MEFKQTQKIKSLALQAREDFENKKINDKTLAKLYNSYNKLDNVSKFISSSKKLFPKLNCGLASVYLKHKLKSGRIIHGYYKNNKHTFLSLSNNFIIDITADQFGGPRIYLGPLQSPWKL